MSHILRQLDKRRFLGLPIWEFSFNSLPRLYGRIFLRDILLQHPLRTWKGMLAYRRFLRQGRWDERIAHLYDGMEADFREEILKAPGGFLVALGFCQKPVGTSGAGCPAGRFSHQCYVLARDDILDVPTARLATACRDCDIRAIGVAALRAGAAVYIMTSATDIARHLFIPALKSERFRYGLFLQCPYSIPAMILPLLICGVQSLLVGYNEGDCRDYAQFLLADEGTKTERTFLSPTAQAHTLDFLHDVASARQARGQYSRRFQQEASLYVPAANT
jgi:hypothetical protein